MSPIFAAPLRLDRQLMVADHHACLLLGANRFGPIVGRLTPTYESVMMFCFRAGNFDQPVGGSPGAHDISRNGTEFELCQRA